MFFEIFESKIWNLVEDLRMSLDFALASTCKDVREIGRDETHFRLDFEPNLTKDIGTNIKFHHF